MRAHEHAVVGDRGGDDAICSGVARTSRWPIALCAVCGTSSSSAGDRARATTWQLEGDGVVEPNRSA
jgi:hypothetical protein